MFISLVFEKYLPKVTVTWIFLSGVLAVGHAETEQTEPVPVTDVRVLIDVSGSMKQNDPGNIRVPALKLLVNLLPPDTRAGVWLFGSHSTSLVPLSIVDSDWKSRALDSASKIHSRDLFTHIEEALLSAMNGWETEKQPTRRSIILLTDGVVDVSKEPSESAASREAIIGQLVPKLQQLSAQVHTIALSENADHQLLKKLSFDTGGWSKSVQSAEQLQRVFLKMFKKAVPRDSVPLTNNKFKIDSGINEFSVLVFRKPGAKKTHLLDPSEESLSEEDYGANVNWHHEAGYDLITIEHPKAGEWQLIADVDPDNQVMVVTDLKLQLSELPNYVSEKETLDVEIRMTEKGEILTEPDFLDLLKIGLQQTDELGRIRDWELSQETTRSGFFVQTVGDTLSPGKHNFKIIAKGQTFQREIEHIIEVVENPVSLDVMRSSDSEADKVILRLTPDRDIIDIATMSVEASIRGPEDSQETVVVPEADGIWEMAIDNPSEKGRTILNFSVTAKTLRGHSVHPRIRPVVIDERFLNSLDEGNEQSNMDDFADSFSEMGEDEKIQKPDWVMIALIAGGVNLVLIVGGFFLYRFIQKRSAAQEMELLDRLAT